MTTSIYDFSTMSNAEPVGAIGGLGNYGGNGRIIEEGLIRSTSVMGSVPFTLMGLYSSYDSGSMFRAEIEFGTYNTYQPAVMPNGLTFFLSNNTYVTIVIYDPTAQFRSFGIYTNAASLNNPIYQTIATIDKNVNGIYSFPAGVGGKLTAYLDKTLNKLLFFINNTYFIGEWQLSGTIQSVGVMLYDNSSNYAIKSLLLSNDTVPVPLAPTRVSQTATKSTYSTPTNSKIKSGRFNGVPLNVHTRNNIITITALKGSDLHDTLLAINPNLATGTLRLSTNSADAYRGYDMGIPIYFNEAFNGAGVTTQQLSVAYTTGIGPAYLAITGAALPVGSYVVRKTISGVTYNANGGVTSSSNTMAEILIWDFSTKRVRRFNITFVGTAFNAMTYVQTKLLSQWDVDPNTLIESEEITVTTGTNPILFSPDADLKIYNGSTWSANWITANDAGSGIAFASGYKFKARMRSPKGSDLKQVASFYINSDSPQAVYTWEIRTKISFSVYKPTEATSANRLLQTITSANSKTITTNEVTLDSVASEGVREGTNSVAVITAKPPLAAAGSKSIHYNRQTLNQYFDSQGRILVSSPASSTLAAVIGRINTEYGLSIGVDDYVAQPGYVGPAVGVTADVTIVMQGYGYVGTYTFAVTGT